MKAMPGVEPRANLVDAGMRDSFLDAEGGAFWGKTRPELYFTLLFELNRPICYLTTYHPDPPGKLSFMGVLAELSCWEVFAPLCTPMPLRR